MGAAGVIKMYISSVMEQLREGKEITIIGFGNFTVSKVDERTGYNLRTGKALEIVAHNQPWSKAGQNLRVAVNTEK